MENASLFLRLTGKKEGETVKKKTVEALFMVMAFGLIGCGGGSQPEDEYSDSPKGFMEPLGNRMVETPDGYYTFQGNYLTFLDKELENPTIVCNKPNCLHNEEDMEKRVECDAFFSTPEDIKYYNGKLYICSHTIGRTSGGLEIYKVSTDGSEKKKLYSEENSPMMLVIYEGDIVVYAPYYDMEHESKVCSIVRFPIENPNEAEVIFESTEFERGEINYLVCEEDKLYFKLIDSANMTTYPYELDLNTNEIKLFSNEIDSSFYVGEDCMIGSTLDHYDYSTYTWYGEVNLYDKNGKKIQTLTEKEFPPLADGGQIYAVDDDYIYFVDKYYGDDAKSKEEQYISIYTYEGECVGKIAMENLETLTIIPGSKDYMIIYTLKNGKDVFYKIDKSQFGKQEILEMEEFLRYDLDDYSGFAVAID